MDALKGESVDDIIIKLNNCKFIFDALDGSQKEFKKLQNSVKLFISRELRTNPKLRINKLLKIALLDILLAIGTLGRSVVYGLINLHKGDKFLFFSKNQLGKELNNARRHLV